MFGQDFVGSSFPVSFNEPVSQLQRCAEDLEYADLLNIAAMQESSAERMVYVAAFAYSKYASTIGVYAKSFNPLLGETYEYARPDENYRFLAEQVSHHPPNSAVWAESSKWTYYGESAIKSKFYGKAFDIIPSGTWFLQLRLASGLTELYTWKKPAVSVTMGVVAGSPTIENYGPMDIKNWTTGGVCAMDSWKVSSDSEFSGSIIDSSGRKCFDLSGRLNSRMYAKITLGYEAHIERSGQDELCGNSTSDSNQAFVVWEAKQLPADMPFNLTPFLITMNDIPDKLRVYLPPTDTRFRPDQRAVEENQYELAAAEKKRLEEKQRDRRREREFACEDFVPCWFRKAKCNVTGEEYWDFDSSYWKERAKMEGKNWKEVEDIFSTVVPIMYAGVNSKNAFLES